MLIFTHHRASVIAFLSGSFVICCSSVFAKEPIDDANASAPIATISSASTLANDDTANHDSIVDQPPLRDPIKIDSGSQQNSDSDKVQGTSDSVGVSKVEDSVKNEKVADAPTTAADAQAPNADGQSPSSTTSTTSTTSGTSGSSDGKSKRTFGNILKSNIVETFELDPRLKKDLTEGSVDLRPVRLMQDYFAIGYNPSIEWDRTNGPPWQTSYSKNNMAMYAVGPITKHLSMWLQPLPLANSKGLANWFELCQGLLNYGNDKTLVQLQGGQGFNWQNAGWGGADRTITQTYPGVYTAFNGFDPTATSKMISLSGSALNWTTGKVFGYWQPGASTSSDPNITYNRGYGVGLSGEKLIGKTGISGIQTNLTMGSTPAFNGNTNPYTGNIIGRQPTPFIWWTSWINKSFQDRKGYVRLNPSFGFTAFHQARNLDDPTLPIPGQHTTGYGYTFDLVAIPVRSYLTTVLRYDQFRFNGTSHDNTTYTFSAGEALDLHLPDKGRLRVTFDYQLIGQHTQFPSHRLILGFWPIW